MMDTMLTTIIPFNDKRDRNDHADEALNHHGGSRRAILSRHQPARERKRALGHTCRNGIQVKCL